MQLGLGQCRVTTPPFSLAPSAFWNLVKGEIQFILSPNVTLPKLRGQPKLHKLTSPFLWSELTFRPIIGGKSSLLSNLSTLLEKVLRPLSNCVPCRLQDSFEAYTFLHNIDFSKSRVETYDAVSLYTKISLDLALKEIGRASCRERV